MNFQNMPPIEGPQFFLDVALSKAKKRLNEIRPGVKGTRLEKSRKLEISRIETIKDEITKRLDGILKSYPSLDELDTFYIELVKCTLDYVALKKSLGALNWASKQIKALFFDYRKKIRSTRELGTVNTHRGAFIGRAASYLKQIKEELEYLEHARKVMKGYPSIKTSRYTVGIAGFPNVGKTTLLYKLSGSKADIQPYAFTTKKINIGYLDRVQLLDTPGTLDRFDKMNTIEKIAHLALELVADEIIYVFDLTEASYPLKKQQELFKRTKEIGRPVTVYLSKTDLIEDDKLKARLEKFLDDYDAVADIKKLKNHVISSSSDA